jgi:hypothetical protein
LSVSFLPLFLPCCPHDAKGRRATTYHDELHPDSAIGSPFAG